MTSFAHAIVFVRSMSRSVAFYRDTVGLRLRFESPGWSEFETGTTTLALHLAGQDESKMDRPLIATFPGTCQLGLNVEDLKAFHARMEAAGVTCIREPRVEDFGGFMALYEDPDGLGFSVVESRAKS